MTKLFRYLINKYLIFKTYLKKYVSLKVGKGAYLPYNAEIKTAVEVGIGTGINGKIRILGGAKVNIGKYCAIGSDVKIISSNHDISKANLQAKFATEYFKQSLDLVKYEINIGHNVWIGDSVIILPNVTIGNGAVLGAGTIVTKDVPDFAVVAGIPAKVIKYRFSKNIIEELQKIEWWNWSEKKIIRNRKFFETDLTKISTKQLEKLIK